jgi:hypothetical protein
VGAFHGNLPQVTRLSSCFLDTGLGNLRKVPFAERKQLGVTLTKMYWLLGHKSKLSTSNKILVVCCNFTSYQRNILALFSESERPVHRPEHG